MRGLTTFFLLAFSLGCAFMSAQEKYTTIPDAFLTKVWHIYWFDDNGGYHTKSIFQTQAATDSIINGLNYSVYADGFGKNNVSTYFLRQSGNKIYRFFDDMGKDLPLYDFSLNVGDVFETHEGKKMQVTEKGIAKDYAPYWNDNCPDRVMLRLIDMNNSANEDIWIEGVGSVYTGILSSSDFNDKTSHVDFVYNQDNSVNPDDYAVFLINIEGLKSVPCAANRLQNEDYDDYMDFLTSTRNFDMEFLDDTLCVKGYCGLSNPLMNLRAVTSGEVITLSVEDVNYLPITHSDYKFNVRIPGFKPGTYTIKYYKRDDVVLACGSSSTPGDINSDGTVNINDVVCIINHMAGAASWSKADVNRDKVTNINDVVVVINIMATSAP